MDHVCLNFNNHIITNQAVTYVTERKPYTFKEEKLGLLFTTRVRKHFLEPAYSKCSVLNEMHTVKHVTLTAIHTVIDSCFLF